MPISNSKKLQKRPGSSRAWHKDFFQDFANPNMITEFWVTKSKDSKYLLAELN